MLIVSDATAIIFASMNLVPVTLEAVQVSIDHLKLDVWMIAALAFLGCVTIWGELGETSWGLWGTKLPFAPFEGPDSWDHRVILLPARAECEVMSHTVKMP